MQVALHQLDLLLLFDDDALGKTPQNWIAAVDQFELGHVDCALVMRNHHRCEIAIRIALGAKPANILSAVLRQFLWPIAIGLLTEVAGTAALSQLLRKVLFGVSNLDPLSYAGAMGVLLAIATAAAVLPARQAFRVDPLGALRYD